MPAMTTLTPAARRALRAQAHELHPVVIIGHSGLTPAVMHEIDVNLLAHELIKVRVANDSREEREAWFGRVCEELLAQPVQHIGKLLVIYRPRPEEEKAAVPVKPRRDAIERGDRRTMVKAPAANKPAAKRPGTRKPSEPPPRSKRLLPSSEREVSAAARRRRGQDAEALGPAGFEGTRRRSRGKG